MAIGVLLVARRLRLLIGVEVVHADHVVFDEGAPVRQAPLIFVVVQARVHVAEHDVTQVRAFALDDVEHPMGVALPARKMNGERSAAELGGARGASQHLLLGGREVLADPDLADNSGADLGLVLRDAAVLRDRFRDRFDRHVLHIRRDATVRGRSLRP